MSRWAIHARNLKKAFGSKVVLEDVNLYIQQGQSWVILGRSGSGKSVMLKCLLGLLPIDYGRISFYGRFLHRHNEQERRALFQKIGMLFQGSALFDSLSVWENVAFGLIYNQKLPHAQAKEKALETLELVGLSPDVALLYPSELSGGMQRRVALARAIILKPQILLCDEPTAGLDPSFSAHISTLIRNSIRQLGATAITITHDLKAAHIIADHVAFLEKGRIVWAGPIDKFETVSLPCIQEFLNPHVG